MSEYGVTLGMAIPVLYMPATVIGSIALGLTPELAECCYRGDHVRLQWIVEKALKVTVLIACSLIPPFFVFGSDMGILLFSSARSGDIIRYASFMLLPLSLNMISTSILNSLGCEKHTLLYFFFGAAAMLVCVWFLPQYMGVYALCLGQAISHVSCCALELLLLKKRCVKPPSYLKFSLLCLCIAAAELGLGSLLYPTLLRLAGVVPALVLGGLGMASLQFFLLCLTGAYKEIVKFDAKRRKNGIKPLKNRI